MEDMYCDSDDNNVILAICDQHVSTHVKLMWTPRYSWYVFEYDARMKKCAQ